MLYNPFKIYKFTESIVIGTLISVGVVFSSSYGMIADREAFCSGFAESKNTLYLILLLSFFISFGLEQVIGRMLTKVHNGHVIAVSPFFLVLILAFFIANIVACRTKDTTNTVLNPIATFTPESTLIPEVPPLSGEFVDNFEGSLRPEWQILQSGFSIKSGTIYSQRGLLFLDIPDQNYIIRAKVQGGFRIIFRATPTQERIDEGYIFGCNNEQCVWLVYQDGNTGSISPSVDRGQIFPLDSEYYDLELMVSGRNFRVKINGNDFMAISDERIHMGKGIALESIGVELNYTTYFESLEVIPITP